MGFDLLKIAAEPERDADGVLQCETVEGQRPRIHGIVSTKLVSIAINIAQYCIRVPYISTM